MKSTKSIPGRTDEIQKRTEMRFETASLVVFGGVSAVTAMLPACKGGDMYRANRTPCNRARTYK